MSLDFATLREKGRQEFGLVMIAWDMTPCSVVDKYQRLSHKHLGYSGRLTFRHRASCMLGQAFHYSPENAFYIFNQQIYFII